LVEHKRHSSLGRSSEFYIVIRTMLYLVALTVVLWLEIFR